MPCERLSLGIFEIDHGLSYSREFLSALVAFRAVSSNQVNLGVAAPWFLTERSRFKSDRCPRPAVVGLDSSITEDGRGLKFPVCP